MSNKTTYCSEVKLDGTLVLDGEISTSPYNVPIDFIGDSGSGFNLPIGVYIFEITAFDAAGNTATDFVTVVVTAEGGVVPDDMFAFLYDDVDIAGHSVQIWMLIAGIFGLMLVFGIGSQRRGG